MADAPASIDGRTANMATRIRTDGIARADVQPASVDAVQRYEALCAGALFAPAQGEPWVRHWTGEVKPDAVFATLFVDEKPVLALALEVVRSGPFRIAQFMGGRHANGNFPAAERSWLGNADSAATRRLFDAIARARPDVDVVALQRLLPELEGYPNPLAGLAGFPSPDLSLAVDLAGGFEAVLQRTSARRKRKKHRSQIRKFEAAGGFRRIRAETADQVRALLDSFFAMKEQRFRRMGVADAFGHPQVRVFFHALFADALSKAEPPFALHGLEVAGRLRAVTGSSLSGRRLICEFGGICEDDMAHASPGEFLFFENIEEACAQGFDVYDFSVGDEPYKRQWCDLETQHRDVLVPLTAKGRALAWGLHGNARLKSWVKKSPTIWRLTKRLRRKAVGKPPAGDDAG